MPLTKRMIMTVARISRLTIMLIIGICIITLGVSLSQIDLQTVEVNDQAELKEPMTGARASLGFLGDVRTYPNDRMPALGFAQAFEEARLMEINQKEKGKANTVWETLGPVNIGGRTLALAINPDHPDTMFAGSASGGLWKTTVGGVGLNAWEYVSTGFPVLGVGAISIDPQAPEVMFIGTGESYGTDVNMPGIGPVRTTRGSYGIGILKSTDGGDTWEQSLDWTVDQRRSVQKIQVNPLRSNSVWAATSEGTFRSYDGGDTWELIHEVVMATDVIINPADTNIVFTANGGMASLGHGIYRTQDGGASFEKMDLVSGGGPATFMGKAVLDISQSDPNIIMASIGNSDGSIGAVPEGTNRTWLVRSLDGGDTWTTQFSNDNAYAVFQGWYSHAIAIDPTNPQIVWAVGQPQAIYRSTFGGIGFVANAPVSTSPPGQDDPTNLYPYLGFWADSHDIIFHPTNPDIFYVANDGGIFRNTDGGTITNGTITMENLNSGYQTTQFYNGVSNSDTNPDLLLGGLQDNNSVIYEGSTNWRRGWAGDGGWTALNQEDNNIAYLSAQFGQATISNDLFTSSQFGDASFRPAFDIFPTSEANFITPMIISPANNQLLWMGGERIYKTTDNVNWTITNNGNALDGNAMSAMAASHQDEDVVYATSSPKVTRSNVYRTNNGGDSWINITGSLPDRFPTDISVDPNNDDIAYITFGGFGSSHVYKTTDAGANWIDIGIGLPDIPTWAVTVDPDFPDHIYVGNELGVFQSLDGGSTWENINGNLPDATFAFDLVISTSNRKLRVATHGNGVYQTDLTTVVSTDEDPSTPEAFTLEQNFPNPFNPSTTIRYNLRESGQVRLEVFDVNGRQVATLVDGNQASGAHSVVFDARGLASGTYIYRLQLGAQVLTRKMTLIK